MSIAACMSCGSVRWSEALSSCSLSSLATRPRNRRRLLLRLRRLVLVALVLLVIVAGVGIVAELVAVAEILDHPAGEAGEGLLVAEHVVEPGRVSPAWLSRKPRQRSRTFCAPPGSVRPVASWRTR